MAAQPAFQIRVVNHQGAGNAVSYGLGLGVDSPALHFDNDSETVHRIAYLKGFDHGFLPGHPVEILIHWFVIDQYGSAVVQIQTYLGDGRLAFPGAVEISLICRGFYQVRYLTFVI